MILRSYHSADCGAIARLFYETVHAVNAADYSPAQLDAWATGTVELAQWDASFRAHLTLLAEVDGVLVGFADMAPDGYLDRLYVHKDYLRQGIATALCDRLEAQTPSACYVTNASITARPFFEQRGYRVICAQRVERRGVILTNYRMEKRK